MCQPFHLFFRKGLGERFMGNLDGVIEKRETKTVRIGDYFTVTSSNRIFHNDSVDGSDVYRYGLNPYIVRSALNNGVKKWVDLSLYDASDINPGNVLTFAQDTFVAFYQSMDFITGNKVKIIDRIDGVLSEEIGLYVATAINKSLSTVSWGSGSTVSDILDYRIDLPIDSAGNPDWDFIEAYINDVKEAYINEIHGYLALEGFAAYEDTILTNDEAAMLAREVETKPFRVGELFGDDLWASVPQAKSQSDVVTVDPLSDDAVQYVVQSLSNNMTSRFVSCESVLMNDYKIMTGKRIALGVTLPAVSYQPRAFTGSQLITLDVSDYSEDVSLYLVTHFRKHSQLFSYGNKPGLAKYKDLVFDLPVDSNNDPDWDYMAAYIRAVKKLSIRSTRQRMDTELEAYAKVKA